MGLVMYIHMIFNIFNQFNFQLLGKTFNDLSPCLVMEYFRNLRLLFNPADPQPYHPHKNTSCLYGVCMSQHLKDHIILFCTCRFLILQFCIEIWGLGLKCKNMDPLCNRTSIHGKVSTH